MTVDGQAYTVTVEELKEGVSQASAQVPVNPVAAAAPAPAPAPTPAAKAPEAPKVEAREEAAAPTGGGLAVEAPMPGQILAVNVKEGDSVSAGDVLLVLEAMKMENELTAPEAGTVSQVLVKQGDAVNSGDPLVMLS